MVKLQSQTLGKAMPLLVHAKSRGLIIYWWWSETNIHHNM